MNTAIIVLAILMLACCVLPMVFMGKRHGGHRKEHTPSGGSKPDGQPLNVLTRTSREVSCYFGIAIVTAFTTNLVWEMTQMHAYRELDVQPFWATFARCAVASGADVLLTGLAYAVGAAVSRNARWAWRGGAKTYGGLAALGFVTAVIGEHFGLASGRWSYNDRMPMLPGIEVGAWPALQLTILIPLSFAVGNFRRRRIS